MGRHEVFFNQQRIQKWGWESTGSSLSVSTARPSLRTSVDSPISAGERGSELRNSILSRPERTRSRGRRTCSSISGSVTRQLTNCLLFTRSVSSKLGRCGGVNAFAVSVSRKSVVGTAGRFTVSAERSPRVHEPPSFGWIPPFYRLIPMKDPDDARNPQEITTATG